MSLNEELEGGLVDLGSYDNLTINLDHGLSDFSRWWVTRFRKTVHIFAPPRIIYGALRKRKACKSMNFVG